ncbi:putative glycosyl transferase [Actinobacillus equuli]|nr:putative glycosyl transferase [Actinobacillus equuli]
MNPVKDLKAVYLLVKELKQLQPDIAFSTFIKPVILAHWLQNSLECLK